NEMAEQLANNASAERGLDLKRDLAFLLNSPFLHDVTIVCADGVQVNACSAFLAARSTAFAEILFGPNRDAFSPPKKSVALEGINSPALNIVVRYIHTEAMGVATLAPSLAMEVWHAASFFRLSKLMGVALVHVKDIKDVAVASRLLNNAIAFIAP